MQRQNHSPERIAALDGLRGLACLMVFGVHFGQITQLDARIGPFELGRLLANGNVGVALFFALSGMLLSLPLWQAKLEPARAPHLGRYFAYRCARILPAYYICLTALIIANRHWSEAMGWSDIGLHYALAFNYFDWSIFSINPPFWTIAVEVQFYLLLPLLFAPTRRMGAVATAIGVLVLAAASYATYVWLIATIGWTSGPRAVSPVLTYSLLGHLPHFLLGVLAGRSFLRLRHSNPRRPWNADAPAWACLAAILIVLSTPIDDWLQIPYGRYNLPYVPVLIAILITTAPFASIMSKLLDGFPLRHLGLISYGVYIYHLPAQHVTARYLGHFSISAQEHWGLFGLLSLALTIAIAAGSYLTVERPIARAIRRLGKRRLL
ncbi:MAG: acyltransferase [Burkholderiales bacterium]|nr:acyltransferase [Burkholderiales bacterium]